MAFISTDWLNVGLTSGNRRLSGVSSRSNGPADRQEKKM